MKGRASLFIIETTPLDRCERELASGTSLGVKVNQLCLTNGFKTNEVASGILSLEVVGSSRPNIVHWSRTMFPSAANSSSGNLSQVGICKLVQNIVSSESEQCFFSRQLILHEFLTLFLRHKTLFCTDWNVFGLLRYRTWVQPTTKEVKAQPCFQGQMIYLS